MFGNEVCFIAEGGSIPFICEIQEMFPKSEMIVTGLLGPESNAHGPNENCDLVYLDKLVKTLGRVLVLYSDN